MHRMAAMVLGMAAACDCGGPEPGAIDIVPPLVYVRPEGASTTTFRLEARLWTDRGANRKGIPETDGVYLEWTPSKPWLWVKEAQGHTVTLELKKGYSDTDAEAVVAVSVRGIKSNPSARVVVLTDVAASSNDTLRARVASDLMPNVAVVSGVRAVESDCPESLFAFVRTAPLGQLDDKCGAASTDAANAAVLAVDRRMAAWAEDWNGDAGAVGLQGELRRLPIKVWIAIAGTYLESDGGLLSALQQRVRDFAREEIREANAILAASRAGITLDTVGPSEIVPADEIGTIGTNCWDADSITTSVLDDTLNVYYIEEFTSNTRGLECDAHEGRAHPTVYVAWYGNAPVTLAHEIGHALSLSLPDDGHTYHYDAALLPGFDVTNVMADYLDHGDAAGRNRFTVGQAFRMNLDSASWLNVATNSSGLVRELSAPRLACQCPVDAVPSPCPRLVDDAAPPGPSTGGYNAAWCSDELRLKGGASLADSAVGLVAGRRWRAPFTTCIADLPGRAVKRTGEIGLVLTNENLTRPGKCPSWAAVFFWRNAPMYVTIEDAPTGWLDNQNEVNVPDALTGPWDVPVHVWYLTGPQEAALRALAEADLLNAKSAFGEENRSGIKLAPAWHAVTAIQETSVCVPNTMKVDSINVYYVPNLNGRTGSRDGRYCPPQGATDVIVVNTNLQKHSATAFGHYLGRALGLDSVKVSDHFPPEVLKGNQMRGRPSDRGTRLTLGQVFRVHFDSTSWLNRSPPSPERLNALAALDVPDGLSAFDCKDEHKERCPATSAVVP